MTTFAAIDIGAYEIVMKIFEISAKNGMKEIDCIRQRTELGADTYAFGYISYDKIESLCRILTEFRTIMEGYRVDVYRACGKSALRETSNILLILEQIKSKTGLHVDILSNSEHRFIKYKSIAFQETEFLKMIEKPTAIADVGEGSLQISLFNKECLVTTQNIRMGTMRLREKLSGMEEKTSDLSGMAEELMSSELFNFRKLFLKDKEIKNLIVLGSFLPKIIKKANNGEPSFYLSKDALMAELESYRRKDPESIAEELEISPDVSELLNQSIAVYRSLIGGMDVEEIWAPSLSLCEGLAYEYAEQNHYLKNPHNFENDILAAGKNIAKRYMCNTKHAEVVENFAMILFDGLKGVHDMGKRERLLLRLAAQLHSCGKYISMSYSAECTYNIIASTEIIGLSHTEREIVANVAKYNTMEFPDYKELAANLQSADYLTVAKLTAILRIANEMDKGHRQKFKSVKTVLKKDVLTVTINSAQNMTLEIGMMDDKRKFFENVFGVKLLIKQKIKQ